MMWLTVTLSRIPLFSVKSCLLLQENNYTVEIKKLNVLLENFDKQANQLLNDNLKLERENKILKQDSRGRTTPTAGGPHPPTAGQPSMYNSFLSSLMICNLNPQ